MGLPISLPLGDTAAELEPYPNSWTDKFSYMLTKTYAGEKKSVKESFYTVVKCFNQVFWWLIYAYLYFLLTPAECTMVKDKLVTFNKRKYKNEMPHSCYQVLAQDCTSELKFMVLLKRDQAQEENEINVKIENM